MKIAFDLDALLQLPVFNKRARGIESDENKCILRACSVFIRFF